MNRERTAQLSWLSFHHHAKSPTQPRPESRLSGSALIKRTACSHHCFEGNTGIYRLQQSPWDPKGGTAKAFIEARVDLDGMWVISDYRQERDGKATYRGHGVFGWDPKSSAYTMYWFDSMGMDAGGPARGKWEGNTLLFEMKTPMGHSRYEYRFQGDGRFAFAISLSEDGKIWNPWLDSTWVRK